MTAAGFDQVQVHVDHLSGKVHAVPTRATDTATDAARIVLEMALRSGDGIPDVLVVDHDPKFTSALFKEFTRRIGSSLLIGSAYHKNTNAKAERVNGVLGDTLRAFANGRKDDWDVWLPYAVFAINNAASTLGGDLTPFFIDRGQHPRLPLSLPDLRAAGEPPAAYATRMKALEQEVRALLHAAQQERKAALDRGRVDTTFQVGDQVMLRTKELLDAAEVGKLRPQWEGPFPVAAVAGPKTCTLTLPARFKGSPTVNVDRLKPYVLRAGRPPPPTRPSTRARWGSTWRSSSSTAKRSAAGLTTWCGESATPRRPIRGSRPSTLRTARSASLSTRRPHPAALRPSALRPSGRYGAARAGGRPARSAAPFGSAPSPRPDGVWRPRRARRASAPPSSIGVRTRAGSSGASGAAAGEARKPSSSATGRRPRPSRARSTRSSTRPTTALAGSR